MILGRITGKVTTTEFSFLVEKEQASKKLEFVQVIGADSNYYLCQIVELERDSDKTIAKCRIIGHKDEKTNRILQPRLPFKPGTEVLLANEGFIKKIIFLRNPERGAFMGHLEDKNVRVNLDLNKILTKHIAILAKSGAGKSYTSGVLVEEILDKGVPILIFDPHGEYSSLKEPNPSKEDENTLKSYGLGPKGYPDRIIEYGEPEVIKGALSIRLKDDFTPSELTRILPSKITPGQKALLYASIKDLEAINLGELMFSISNEESNQKYQLLGVLDVLKKASIFSENALSYSNLIKKGQLTLFNLKGYNPYIQQVIVYLTAKKLFELRKRGKVPPFFMLVEEAHNFCPERSFGEAICSPILRIIASEGRKFGIGLCVISQRPARVDKNVLSQCSTQVLMKMTNPNDLKAISNSVEGVTYETESVLMNLPIGSALISGFVDVPLVVRIRKRKTRHGGEAEKVLNELSSENFEEDFLKETKDYKDKNKWVVYPNISKRDIKLMSKKKIERVSTILFPALFVKVEDKDKNSKGLLFDLISGKQILDLDERKTSADYMIEESQDFQLNHEEIEADKVMEEKLSPETVLNRLKNYIILEKKKCFGVLYKPTYSKEQQ